MRYLCRKSWLLVGQETCKTYHVSRNPICCNHQILAINEADLVQVKRAKTINVKRSFGTKLLPKPYVYLMWFIDVTLVVIFTTTVQYELMNTTAGIIQWFLAGTPLRAENMGNWPKWTHNQTHIIIFNTILRNFAELIERQHKSSKILTTNEIAVQTVLL